MKKILVVAFIFPPTGGSGVQRTLKFTKYLPEFGWQPYVVCGDDGEVFGDGLDASLEADVPVAVQVWRRRFVNPLGLHRWVQRLVGMKERVERLESARQLPAIVGKKPGGVRFLFKLLSAPLGPFEFPPVDAAVYWALEIVPGCLRLIRREKIDVIYTTSFPYSDHVAGYLLKKLSGKPWVADFRDPWTKNASARNTGWRYRVDQWVEQRVLCTADRIISVTPSYTAGLRRLAPGRAADDFVTIENGYDRADFSLGEASLLGTYQQNCPTPAEAEISSQKPLEITREGIASQTMLSMTGEMVAKVHQNPGQPIKLAHVGYLYDGTALPFFQALEALGQLGSRLQINFIGGLAPQEERWLVNHSLAVQIIVEDRLPHNQAIQVMRNVDFLLLLLGTNAGWLGNYPGKLFEYMASGTPILFIGPPGDTSALLERTGTGYFAPADNPSTILDALRLLAEKPDKFRQCYFQPRPEVIAAYEREAQTSMLASVLNGLI